MIIAHDRNPCLSLYFLGAQILHILNDCDGIDLDLLFDKLKSTCEIDIPVAYFYYALDWLYLIDKVKLANGRIFK